jgi:hypothetical protein
VMVDDEEDEHPISTPLSSPKPRLVDTSCTTLQFSSAWTSL